MVLIPSVLALSKWLLHTLTKPHHNHNGSKPNPDSPSKLNPSSLPSRQHPSSALPAGMHGNNDHKATAEAAKDDILQQQQHETAAGAAAVLRGQKPFLIAAALLSVLTYMLPAYVSALAGSIQCFRISTGGTGAVAGEYVVKASLWTGDLSLTCWSGLHIALVVVAAVIGLPCLVGYLLLLALLSARKPRPFSPSKQQGCGLHPSAAAAAAACDDGEYDQPTGATTTWDSLEVLQPPVEVPAPKEAAAPVKQHPSLPCIPSGRSTIGSRTAAVPLESSTSLDTAPERDIAASQGVQSYRPVNPGVLPPSTSSGSSTRFGVHPTGGCVSGTTSSRGIGSSSRSEQLSSEGYQGQVTSGSQPTPEISSSEPQSAVGVSSAGEGSAQGLGSKEEDSHQLLTSSALGHVHVPPEAAAAAGGGGGASVGADSGVGIPRRFAHATAKEAAAGGVSKYMTTKEAAAGGAAAAGGGGSGKAAAVVRSTCSSEVVPLSEGPTAAADAVNRNGITMEPVGPSSSVSVDTERAGPVVYARSGSETLQFTRSADAYSTRGRPVGAAGRDQGPAALEEDSLAWREAKYHDALNLPEGLGPALETQQGLAGGHAREGVGSGCGRAAVVDGGDVYAWRNTQQGSSSGRSTGICCFCWSSCWGSLASGVSRGSGAVAEGLVRWRVGLGLGEVPLLALGCWQAVTWVFSLLKEVLKVFLVVLYSSLHMRAPGLQCLMFVGLLAAMMLGLQHLQPQPADGAGLSGVRRGMRHSFVGSAAVLQVLAMFVLLFWMPVKGLGAVCVVLLVLTVVFVVVEGALLAWDGWQIIRGLSGILTERPALF